MFSECERAFFPFSDHKSKSGAKTESQFFKALLNYRLFNQSLEMGRPDTLEPLRGKLNKDEFSPELLDTLDEVTDEESLLLEACRQDSLYPIYFQHINAGRMQVLLACAPYIVHSSLTLLILFLCYTLLPLPLLPTALAAAVISATGLSIQLINSANGTLLISHAILFLAINIVGFLVFYPLELVQRKTFRET
ncbi:hypothetical protein NECAME_00934, partial [Necator americanus]